MITGINDPERRVELAQLVLERAAYLISERRMHELISFGRMVDLVLTSAGLPRVREPLHRTRPACLMQAVADLTRELDRRTMSVEALGWAKSRPERIAQILRMLETPCTHQEVAAAKTPRRLLKDLYRLSLISWDEKECWTTHAGKSALVALSR